MKLKIVPNSSKDCLSGWLGDSLKIKIKAPPEQGKANIAIEKFIAKQLNLSRQNVNICSGFTQANKVIEIRGLDKANILDGLGIGLAKTTE